MIVNERERERATFGGFFPKRGESSVVVMRIHHHHHHRHRHHHNHRCPSFRFFSRSSVKHISSASRGWRRWRHSIRFFSLSLTSFILSFFFFTPPFGGDVDGVHFIHFFSFFLLTSFCCCKRSCVVTFYAFYLTRWRCWPAEWWRSR